MALALTAIVLGAAWIATAGAALLLRVRPATGASVGLGVAFALVGAVPLLGVLADASQADVTLARAATALAAGASGALAGATLAVALRRPAHGLLAALALAIAFGAADWAGAPAPPPSVAAGGAAVALAWGRPWARWAAAGLAAVALAQGAAAAFGSGPDAPALAALALGAVAFAALGARGGLRRGALVAALAFALAGALALTLAPPGATRALGVAAWAGAATFAALGAARPALGAAWNRAIAGAAGTLATWAVVPRLAVLEPAVTFAAGITFGLGAAIGIELVMPRLRPARPSATEPEPARETEPSGVILGRYRIVEHLGDGGAGRTYLAEDLLQGGRRVVKVPRDAAAAEGIVFREARALATIRHPHVVRIDGVEEENGERVLVMEHVEGGSLQARLARGPLDREAFGRLARGLLDALAAVHEAGFVHQDVKPPNVLLTRAGDAKLADFGVARATGADVTMATSGGAWPVGTIRYMSPEQARGRAATIASDLYAAGATLYEACTGEPYLAIFENESAVELQMRAATWRPFDRDIEPPALRAWFARALAPDPAARFGSAREMRAAFDAAFNA